MHAALPVVRTSAASSFARWRRGCARASAFSRGMKMQRSVHSSPASVPNSCSAGQCASSFQVACAPLQPALCLLPAHTYLPVSFRVLPLDEQRVPRVRAASGFGRPSLRMPVSRGCQWLGLGRDSPLYSARRQQPPRVVRAPARAPLTAPPPP